MVEWFCFHRSKKSWTREAALAVSESPAHGWQFWLPVSGASAATTEVGGVGRMTDQHIFPVDLHHAPLPPSGERSQTVDPLHWKAAMACKYVVSRLSISADTDELSGANLSPVRDNVM